MAFTRPEFRCVEWRTGCCLPGYRDAGMRGALMLEYVRGAPRSCPLSHGHRIPKEKTR